MLRLLLRLTLATTLTLSVASNLLLLTSATFNTAISGVLATALGVRTVSSVLSSRLAASQARTAGQRVATRKFGQRLAARTSRVAARSIAAIPAEAVPYLGAAVIVGTVSYELYAACETLEELNTLYTDLGVDEEVPRDTLSYICDPPDFREYLPMGKLLDDEPVPMMISPPVRKVLARDPAV
ncbi:MAG: hypothetical protein AAGG55_04830 [Pseudomonadota bacterium]